jgi:hypothetical protein
VAGRRSSFSANKAGCCGCESRDASSCSRRRKIKGLGAKNSQILHRFSGFMAFLIDVQELKPGLIIFRRADVKHRNWYCRIKLPQEDRYKTVSLKTADIDAAKDRASIRTPMSGFRIKHPYQPLSAPCCPINPRIPA